MPLPEEGPYARCYDFWVCANCLLPSKMVFEKLTDRYAPSRATHVKSTVGHKDGTTLITWGTAVSGEKLVTMMFHSYPFVKVNNVDQGRNHLLTLWKKLDDSIDQIRGLQTDLTLIEAEKIRAQTLAEVLAQLMSPFYEDSTAVLRESMNRWTARENNAEHESPGLAETHWDPTSRGGAVAAPGAPAARKRVQLGEDKIRFIKHTLSQNNPPMTAETLAGMFACSIEDIKEAFDS